MYHILDAMLCVSAYIASTSNNNMQYLTENGGRKDMWRTPVSKHHAPPPEPGKGNAKGRVETVHEPTKQRSTLRKHAYSNI